MKRDASPAASARAHSRHLELSVLIQQADWEHIGQFLALDGESFK